MLLASIFGDGDGVGVGMRWTELSRVKSWAKIQRPEQVCHFGGVRGQCVQSTVEGAMCTILHHVKFYIIHPPVKSNPRDSTVRFKTKVMGTV